ncbi:hypothetical protein E3T24_13995 [Cryobacterium sp. TmT2-59]|uniref:Uncharacterized protein n=1 Tax=Cryobacterium shii TaxID=1259235 RepID=A0AAQ2C523_9MICO|nr:MULTISPECIES: hypothetical protein [Cryobacterium]TFC44868.1 hypothetical protein E3O49_11205 [Cryobacterium shii]TFC82158.1 hypothetical protein E3T24_13995 [Cryobacterium sp. TmT2-59]
MASLSDAADELFNQLAASAAPKWETPEDLNRMSIEGLWGSTHQARLVRSTGSIRIFGVNVQDHQARLDAAGQILLNLQRLVTAAGAAKEGIKTNRGQLSGALIASTQLRLLMNPLPGSVVFEIGPEMLPEAELIGAEGVALYDQNRRQFVDECVVDALELVRTAHSIGPDADDSPFVSKVTAGGPRLATAIREFAKGVEQASFDVDLEWREPDRATERATFTKADAIQVKRLVVARELDAETETLRGRLITLSTARAWQIDLGGDHIVTVDTTDLQGVDVTQFHLSEEITIIAKPQVREFAGGGKSITFRAISVTSNEPSA